MKTNVIAIRSLRSLFLITLVAAVTLPAVAQDTASVSGIRAALKAGQYDEAISAADAALKAKVKAADEALYLKALAQFQKRDFDGAVATADQLLKDHPQSAWRYKAAFLKARSLVSQRQWEPAEKIYEAEAHRLLSNDRKKDIAGVLIRFADDLATEPGRNDVGAPPADYGKAYRLYHQALDMQIGRDLRDDVLFKLGRAAMKANNLGQAINDFRQYLSEFDPDWMGPVGSAERTRQQKREHPPKPGIHILDARFLLGESQLLANQHQIARINFEDLLGLIDRVANPDATTAQLKADTSLQIVRTYNLPNPGNLLEQGVKAARDFLARHPAHPEAVDVSWQIGQTYHQAGRADDAIAAYEDFINGKNYDLPDGDAATVKIERLNQSPAELKDTLQKVALFQIGQIRYQQKQYDKAIAAWQGYINRYPNGSQWADAQRMIIDAEYAVAIDAVADEQYGAATNLFTQFLAKHPLDDRARQVLFILGQMHVATVEIAERDAAANGGVNRAPVADEAYRRAIAEWDKLVSKYPNTEESSLALFRTGVLYEEKLGDLDKALDAYRRLTWGSWAGQAQQRIAQMTNKQLTLKTERKFRTNETAQIHVDTRNIEKLTVRQYFLDPEAYFRKTHTTRGVEDLDISLIEPDKTWEVTIDKYAKYKPLSQSIDIPFDGDKPGVCIVNVAEEDLEATTLVVRSNIDVVMRSSRRELLVYAVDMVAQKPAAGVDVLVSDGSEVFATGKTGDDGVFRKAYDQLKSCNDLRVFASTGKHIASNALGLNGLQVSQGLSRKGYIYTDRPAYQPGQVVHARGVIRDVKDGSYDAPAGATWIVDVKDPSGRLLREEEVELSKFGTFAIDFDLDAAAPVGQYAVSARPKDKGQAVVHTGNFLVQQFQLQKMKLAIDLPQSVYFRGEVIKAKLSAEYYWGEPVAGKPVRYNLPDGRSIVDKTDEKGELKFEFDTAGMTPGSTLQFSAQIEGENVWAQATASLPRVGFNMSVKASQDLVLSGEPFDVTVSTTAPDGKPVGRDLTLVVLRRQVANPDPVLTQVPWVQRPKRPSLEVTVETKKVKTDEKTGTANVALKLEKGGSYILRATGDDRFNQPVTAQGRVTISDENDATKLRFFADSNTLKVGGEATVRLHSRVNSGLALLTWEGESIIEHRVVPIKKGYNALKLAIGHEHFPNFRLAVTVMDGKDLRTADKPFKVERELKVAIRPVKGVYAPGGKGQIEIVVTDQLGNPVEAELSLALIDEALYAIYADGTPDILSFFQHAAHRHAEFRVTSTNGFTYTAETRHVIKAIQDEANRLVEVAENAAQLQDARADLKEMAKLEMRRASARDRGGFALGGAIAEKAMAEPMADALSNAPGAPPAPKPTAASGFAMRQLEAADKKRKDDADGVFFGGKGGEGGGGSMSPRRELPEAGVWLPSVVTDKQGKATVTVTLPEKTTQWRITGRGVSVETLVGQATSDVVTRKDFFVEIKSPRAVTEGDTLRLLARVHNLTDYAGPVDLTLVVNSGGKRLNQIRQSVRVKANDTTEVLLESFKAPAAGEIETVLSAEAGELRDALSRTMPVHPWGMEYADHGGGTSTGVAGVSLTLPGGIEYTSRWLTVTVGPSVEQSVINMALNGGVIMPMPLADNGAVSSPRIMPPVGGFDGSELLASVSGLSYAQAVGATETDKRRLGDKVRSLVSALVVTQMPDGGWGWYGNNQTDWGVTSTSYWALARAQQLGVTVNPDTLKRAEQYLNNMIARVAASDNDAKAVILHALSVGKAADFKLVNPLYRERNGLSEIALAYAALTLANLDRAQQAVELLDILEAKAKPTQVGGRQLRNWDSKTRYPWLNDEIESTAVAVLAMMKVKPTSKAIEPAIQFLLNRRGCIGWNPAKSRGPAVAALAGYYASGKFADADYELTVSVNGKPVKTIKREHSGEPVAIQVPVGLIGQGANSVRFEMNGRGAYTYAATLRGFSPEFKDPKSFSYPYVHHRYFYHAPLTYRDHPINASSSSTVSNLEIGQHTRVRVDMYNTGYNGYLVVEEPLPAGATLVDGSLSGGFTHYDVRDGRIFMYYPPGRSVGDVTYELVGYSTGAYRVLPTVIRDVLNPGRMRIGHVDTLNVLGPDEKSKDPYNINDAERYALGKLNFDDGLYKQALEYLWPLFDRESKYNERDVARMLLWIHTTDDLYDARRVVATFEVLSVRHPELTIPFDRILVVGKAYRDLGEFERAYLVFRATIDSSFLADSNISAVLQDEGQLLGSIDYQEDLWWHYPDTAEVASSYFALSQLMYENASRAAELARNQRQVRIRVQVPGQDDKGPAAVDKPTRPAMLAATIRMIDNFMVLYPDSPLADDAAFSVSNAFLDLQNYDAVVNLSQAYRKRFDKSEFVSSFQYMTALGYFWQRKYDPALDAAKVVADGKSKDRDFARYILGQIYHAQGEPAKAIDWYRKVAGKYPDAKQSIDYFEKKQVAIDEVSVFKPGEAVKLELRYRNIPTANLQVYKVDLMKLYLREKNLSNITSVNLAGIEPQVVKDVKLGDGHDYVDKTTAAELPLKDEGAYLVICRGDNLFTSGLVLITPLKIEVQEDAVSGRVRANVIDAVKNQRPAQVHVKAIGSDQSEFRSGDTDLRGLFIADGIRGKVTVIARDADARYAFYRGDTWLGAPANRPQGQQGAKQAEFESNNDFDYQGNLRSTNQLLQKSYNSNWDQLRRSGGNGVQVQQAK